MPRKKKAQPLYEQVKDILNTLQGKTVPSYQGLHAFWLDPDTFKTAILFGQRLIAPKDGDSSSSESEGCCGSSEKTPTPKASTDSCCGGSSDPKDTEAADPAVVAVGTPYGNVSEGNCWPSGGSGGGRNSSGVKRSDRSGIIIGLRGQYPFDGRIYEKLLWDAEREATEDQIQVIANWIDADCPLTADDEKENDKKIQWVALQNKKEALARGEMLHTASTNKTNKDHLDNKGLTVRKEISSLTPDELQTFRDALTCMYSYNDFEQDDRSFKYWAQIHPNSCQHGWEQFVTWHRLYLYFFEQKLQDYNPHIALPYWSWTDYSDLNTNTFNNTKFDLGVIPEAYRCFLTKKGLAMLKSHKSLFTAKEISGLEKLQKSNAMYNSGLRFLAAAGIPYELKNLNGTGEAVWSDKVRAVYNALQADNALWYPNRWPGSMSAANGGAATYPTKKDISNLLALDNFSDFGGGPASDHHFGSLEEVHNGMHNFSGATNPNYPLVSTEWANIYSKLGLTQNPQSLENPPNGAMVDARVTAYDPIFWGHHSNVDRIWAKWQTKHNGTPEAMDASLAPWPMTVKDTMNIKDFGYTYMRDSVFFNVSSDVGLTKFDSEAAKVSANTLENHQKAEIKLHRMRRANLPNARIRVFLNSPGANVDTPTINNEHFVKEITTFHGTCFGGPGHCDLPLDKTRGFDRRPLHHHEPRNYKIDASEAVQRMLNKSENDITIQLVVLGLDGKPIDNAVFVDGVSLNFMD